MNTPYRNISKESSKRHWKVTKKSCKKNPEQIDALHGLGIVLSQLGHQNEALQCLDQAIHLLPSNPSLQNSRGNILSQLDRLVAATVAYARAIQFQPDEASAYNNIVNCFFQQKNVVLPPLMFSWVNTKKRLCIIIFNSLKNTTIRMLL